MNNFIQKGNLKVVKGSILNPFSSNLNLVLSVNDMKGTSNHNPLLPVFEKKWSKVKEDARAWYALRDRFYKLGSIKDLAVQSDVWVMHSLFVDEDGNFVKEALESCLKEILKVAKYERASVHISSILLDKYPEIEEYVEPVFLNNGVNVFLYNEK